WACQARRKQHKIYPETIMSRLTQILATVGCVAALGTGAATAQVSADVVKIGVLTDMAGVTADITGKGSLVAAQMAVEEVGGAILGKPIEVIVGDHQHRTDLGASMARQWYDVDNVDVI